MLIRFAFILLAAVLALPGIALAQHQDIEFENKQGQIFVRVGGGYPGEIDGTRVFTGNLPTSGLSERTTTNPGFATPDGVPIDPNEDIWGQFLLSPSFGGPLVFHDGTSFAATAASLTIQDNSPGGTQDLVLFNDGTFNGDNPQFIGSSGAGGDVHTHIRFTVSPGADFGAYGILMSLQSPDNPNYDDSDPFWIVFNFGLDSQTFQNAVFDFGAVPEPGHGLLVLLGSAVWLSLSRRRRRENAI